MSVTGASNSPQTLSVTLTVTAATTYTMSLSPTSLAFTGQQGGPSPAGQTVTISYAGGGTFDWSASVTAGNWLSVSPARNSGAAGSDVFTVSASSTGLATGMYAGAIQISVSGASNSPATLNVTLSVTAAPTMELTPRGLSFSGQQGGSNPSGQPVIVSCSCGGTFSWSATVTAGTWLSVTPSSGVAVTETTAFNVSVTSTGLGVGTYNGTIQVDVPTAGNSPQSIPVTLTISSRIEAPSISVISPASAVLGGPAFTLTVTGDDFLSNSVVRWNGSDRPTAFISDSQLQAAVSAADIAVAGAALVTVFTPATGGGLSNSLAFNIRSPASPVPSLLSLSPSAAVAGSAGLALVLDGWGVATDSVVAGTAATVQRPFARMGA